MSAFISHVFVRNSASTPGRSDALATNQELTFKELPPPYREDDAVERYEDFRNSINGLSCDGLDLVANCNSVEEPQESEAEYAEIQDMGLWHSTPLAHRHKSKISLTWVLKENLESTKLPLEKHEDRLKTAMTNDGGRYQRNSKFIEADRHRRSKSKERIVGRNEFYHNMKFRSACEEFLSQDTFSDTSVGTEYTKRKHRHRHRRKKRNSNGKFGYDIRDLDSFLSEASIHRPGNIPVVVAYPTTLYQTHKDSQPELVLPLGTVVNAVFKNQQWLYAQTPHGNEGYVMYNACLPLGILPSKTSQKKTPCWESSTDIYPRPCGNLTDTEKENLRGRTRSESRYKVKEKKQKTCAERDFDSLYLRTKSEDRSKVRQTLLVVNSDFKGSELNKTISVEQGEVVVLVQSGKETDVDSEWFYVRKRDGAQGFIPAAVAGHGYI